jgi:uncharacterized membrane protein YdjX (TVP38/TMEM64 family)
MGDLSGLDLTAGWQGAEALLARGVGVLVDWQSAWGVVPGAMVLFAVLTLWSATGLPGCSVLILAIGALFGWVWGTLLVSVASTVGATIAFCVARWGWRSSLQQRHAAQLAQLNRVLVDRGPWVLLMLRVAPAIPFPLLNPLMGLTSMRVLPYFVWSYLGMLGGTLMWVWLGQGLGSNGLDLLVDPRLWLVAAMLVLSATWASRMSRRWVAEATPDPASARRAA